MPAGGGDQSEYAARVTPLYSRRLMPYSRRGSSPSHHLPLPSASVRLPSYGTPFLSPSLSLPKTVCHHHQVYSCWNVMPKRMPSARHTLAHSPIRSRLGPRLTEFHG